MQQHTVARHLVLNATAGTTTREYSRAIAVDGANRAMFHVWNLYSTATTVTAQLFGSNDLANWTALDSTLSVAAGPSYQKYELTSIVTYRHVRLNYVATSGSTGFATLAASVDTWSV